ncbi:AAA family ATPase [Streptomyces sp. NPDC006668]|uniref:helix-turn-helix transcriptional regulator n=1 Tax=Streptomyces sp. NPDC006668 TaxID=3156903 RepID=UPI0033C2B12E
MLPTPSALLERDKELQVLERTVLDTVRGQVRAVLIEGSPGTGRTALLQSVVDAGRRARMRTAVALATPAEAAMPYGIVRQLLAALEDPATPGSRVWRQDDQLIRAVNRAVLRTPVVLAVDDLQWVDVQSWRWMASLAHRSVAGTALLMAGTAHPGALVLSAGGDEPHGRRAAAALGVDAHVVHTRPLSRSGVVTAVQASHVLRDDRYTVDELAEASAGNPAVLHSLLDMRAAECNPNLPDGLIVKAADVLGTMIDRVLDGLSDELITLLSVIAVAGPDLSTDLICQLAELRSMSLRQALGVLAGGSLVTASDPVVCTAGTAQRVLARLTVARREDLYARAAELGHSWAIPRKAVSRMLLEARTVGSPWVAPLLRQEAAAQAVTAPQSAARLMRRALAEPLSPSQREDIVADLQAMTGTSENDAGSLTTSMPAISPSGLPASMLFSDRRAPRGSSPEKPHSWPNGVRPTVTKSDDAALENNRPRARRETMEQASVDPRDEALKAWQWALTMSHPAADAAITARIAVYAASGRRGHFAPRLTGCLVLAMTDHDEEALSFLEQVGDDALAQGAPLAYVLSFALRAAIGLTGGWIEQAAADLESVVAGMPEQHWPMTLRAWVTAMRMQIHMERGEVREARQAAAAHSLRSTDECPTSPSLLRSWGQLLLSEGDLRGAREAFLESGRRLLSSGITTPVLVPWGSMASFTCQLTEETERAVRLAQEELCRARIWGTSSAIAVASLALGLTSSPDATRALDEAAQLLHEGPPVVWSAPFRSRFIKAVIDVAKERSATGEPAAPAVWEIMRKWPELPSAAPATPLGSQADHMPRGPSIGHGTSGSARSPLYKDGSPEHLTGAEARVARLAAGGLSNQAIASQLGVHRRTVELHLTRAYRKLGISSRAGLTVAWRDHQADQETEEGQ